MKSGCDADADCDASAPVTNPAGCAKGTCDTSKHSCSYAAKDKDGDGHAAATCAASDGTTVVVGDDCDDTDSNTYPGAWDGPKGEGHADRCDGLDENCDGMVDNEKLTSGGSCVCAPGDITACSEDASGKPVLWPTPSPMGTCRYGAKTCGSDGAYGPCVGAVGPAASDVCTAVGNDDNCNGKPNDTCACLDVPTDPTYTKSCSLDAAGNPITYPGGIPQGSCKYGKESCTGSGKYAACMGAVGPLAKDGCDAGNDDDCNGIPNEGCGCANGATQPCGSSTGACKPGMQLCTNGAWGACAGGVAPAAEVCNGADDDCDGVVDDNITSTGSCTAGLGACLQAGQLVCDATTNGAFACNAVAGMPHSTPSSTEFTDGTGAPTWDGNCDGTVVANLAPKDVFAGPSCTNVSVLQAYCSSQGPFCKANATVAVCAGDASTPGVCGAEVGTIGCASGTSGCHFTGLLNSKKVACD